jgi:VWFA-related protein
MFVSARRFGSRIRILAAAAACGAGSVLAQQAPQQPPPTFRGGVDVVQVDVSVLDKSRRPVRNLTTADFTIFEDGKPRPIVAFVPVELEEPELAPGRASWVRDVAPDVVTNDARPEGRLIVIMLDWSIRFEDQELARRIAATAIDQLGPGDLAAVVFSSAFANSGTPQNFTADRARLLAAVNRPFAMALHNPAAGPGYDPRNGNYVMIDDPEGYESGDCLCRVCVPETIARVADTVRDVQGRRKTLLFIGTYFRSYESLQGPISRPPAGPPAALTGIVRPSTNTMACAGRLKDAREQMVRATSLANLTIHTLDPVGIETTLNSPLGGSVLGIQERQADLPVLADLTGGRTVMNTEKPEAELPALFAESRAYYLLAFAPADPKADGKLHKIDVKVDRPDVTVRTRSGYYAGETRARGRRKTVVSPEAAALDGVLPRRDVPLSVTVAPFATPGAAAESAVAVVLGVRQEIGADRPQPNGPVRVLAAAFDRNGRSVQSETQTVGVTWRPDAAGSMPYEVLSRLALKPGRYEIRVALDGGASGRASVYTYVDVPDFSQQQLSLSGIVLAASPTVLSAPKDAFADLLPVVPTARRRFLRTDRVTGFLRIYQKAGKPAQPAEVTVRIVDASDRVVTNLVARLTTDRFTGNHADYPVDLPMDRLTSGEYLFTIEARQGELTARRGVRFTVQEGTGAGIGSNDRPTNRQAPFPTPRD